MSLPRDTIALLLLFLAIFVAVVRLIAELLIGAVSLSDSFVKSLVLSFLVELLLIEVLPLPLFSFPTEAAVVIDIGLGELVVAFFKEVLFD